MPTTSCSSPTTTSAVNENRRPPLTTLATRLISTTRSWRSRPDEEPERSRAISRPRLATLEGQPALTGSVGQRLHAAGALVSHAVEHGGLDPGLPGPLGEERAGALGLLHPAQVPQLGLDPVDRRDRAPGVVVDQLGED